MRLKLLIQPITLREANEFVAKHHRHHGPARGCRFSIAVASENQLHGVAIVSRPIAASYDNGWTAEVARLCTDGTPNVASMLYGACWRAAKAMGYNRLITYIRYDETGTSLAAAGWQLIAERPARSWAKQSGRHRIDKTEPACRKLFEAKLA